MNIWLVEVTVLITIGWATTLYWLTRKWLRQKLAWQWWHQQQSIQLHHRAESIRDGLMQQTFAFRRYLEIAETSAADHRSNSEAARLLGAQTDTRKAEHVAEQGRWLERFQTFYRSLETLSNELSPPFVTDSLPLALKFVLKDWAASQGDSQRASDSQLAVPQLSVPADWHQVSPHKNQVILSIVSKLLASLASPNTRPQDLQLTLSCKSALHTLAFSLGSSETQATHNLADKPEIQHLKEIFHSLAAGRLEVSQEGALLTGRLYWRDE